MEARNGAKIGIVAVVLSFLTGAIRLITSLLVFPSFASWSQSAYGLFLFQTAVLAVIILVLAAAIPRVMRALTKPKAMEELYKYPGSGVIVGFLICFPIAAEFTIEGVYYVGDAMSTALFFVYGVLFIMSGIMMVHEVKEGTEQADYEP